MFFPYRAGLGRTAALIAVIIFTLMLSSCSFQKSRPETEETEIVLPERWSLVAQDMSLLAIDPFNAQVAFAIDLPTGRLMRSEDIGRTWQPLDLPGTGVTSLVVAPSDPNLIYAVINNSKIVATRNGGQTWSDLPPLPRRSPSGHPPQIKDLTLDPGNPQLILAAAGPSAPDGPEGGLYRSFDGGRSWEILSLPGAPDRWKSGLTSVAFSRINPIMVMAVGEIGILRSQDSGITWQNVRSGLTQGTVTMGRADEKWAWVVSNSLITVTRNQGDSWTPFELRVPTGAKPELSRIALDPRSPLVAYAAWPAADPKEGGIFRTSDGGRSWSLMVPPTLTRGVGQLFPAPDGNLIWVAVRSPDGAKDSIWHLIVR